MGEMIAFRFQDLKSNVFRLSNSSHIPLIFYLFKSENNKNRTQLRAEGETKIKKHRSKAKAKPNPRPPQKKPKNKKKSHTNDFPEHLITPETKAMTQHDEMRAIHNHVAHDVTLLTGNANSVANRQIPNPYVFHFSNPPLTFSFNHTDEG
jgi:hypothetical protein